MGSKGNGFLFLERLLSCAVNPARDLLRKKEAKKCTENFLLIKKRPPGVRKTFFVLYVTVMSLRDIFPRRLRPQVREREDAAYSGGS